MIKKIDLFTSKKLIYKGSIDLENKIEYALEINDEQFKFDLLDYSKKLYLKSVNAHDLLSFCEENNLKITFYVTGNISIVLTDSHKSIEPCFIIEDNNIFILISINETQPCLYEIWLEGIFRCANASTNR